MRSTNLIEDFDAEWDEDYLPEPPVLAREDATSHVWSVLPDPLEIIPNHTINNPNPANVIIYNEPPGGREHHYYFSAPRDSHSFSRQMKQDFAILRIYTETHRVDRADCLFGSSNRRGPDYELVDTWNTMKRPSFTQITALK